MVKIIFIVFFSLDLLGCVANSPYGNFVNDSTQPIIEQQEKIASDIVEKLTELYPPAKTQFYIKQPTPDFFGTALLNGLRDRGYSLMEFNQDTSKGENMGKGLSLNYLFDQLTGTNTYRVSIEVSKESLSRLYVRQNGKFLPLGNWVYRK